MFSGCYGFASNIHRSVIIEVTSLNLDRKKLSNERHFELCRWNQKEKLNLFIFAASRGKTGYKGSFYRQSVCSYHFRATGFIFTYFQMLTQFCHAAIHAGNDKSVITVMGTYIYRNLWSLICNNICSYQITENSEIEVMDKT